MWLLLDALEYTPPGAERCRDELSLLALKPQPVISRRRGARPVLSC